VRFVFPRLDQAVIADRLKHRHDHFMPPALLASQFTTLESPGVDEPVVVVDGRLSTMEQVESTLAQLRS
jgi:gluconate kinase